jgi:hypothetical protein
MGGDSGDFTALEFGFRKHNTHNVKNMKGLSSYRPVGQQQ